VGHADRVAVGEVGLQGDLGPGLLAGGDERGEWLACALKIAPIALPTPGAVWRLATEARPEACA
jgi:hypothetical protein